MIFSQFPLSEIDKIDQMFYDIDAHQCRVGGRALNDKILSFLLWRPATHHPASDHSIAEEDDLQNPRQISIIGIENHLHPRESFLFDHGSNQFPSPKNHSFFVPFRFFPTDESPLQIPNHSRLPLDKSAPLR